LCSKVLGDQQEGVESDDPPNDCALVESGLQANCLWFGQVGQGLFPMILFGLSEIGNNTHGFLRRRLRLKGPACFFAASFEARPLVGF
jgi:hypothetical protein